MSIRRIFSARAAQPRVERALEAMVKAAVFLGCADGRLEEVEVDSLVDGVRDVARRAMGDELATLHLPVARVLDWAREGLRDFAQKGEAAFLADLARALEGDFRQDALLVAFRVIAADHTIAPLEEAAFDRLVAALGYERQEQDVLAAMARASVRAVPEGIDAQGIEVVKALQQRGWRDPYVELRAAGMPVYWFDAALQYVPEKVQARTLLRLELDARERVLHLHVTDDRDVGPHLVIYYGEVLPEVVRLIDASKDTLAPDSVEEQLGQLYRLCPDTYLEAPGRLVRLAPSPGAA